MHGVQRVCLLELKAENERLNSHSASTSVARKAQVKCWWESVSVELPTDDVGRSPQHLSCDVSYSAVQGNLLIIHS